MAGVAVLLAMAVGSLGAVEGRSADDSSRVVVLSLASRTFDNTRSIRVYLPAGYSSDTTRRYPTFYLNDGFAVFSPRSWNAPRTLDSLIRAAVIPPMIVVGIDNGASIPGQVNPGRARANEYLPYPDPAEPDVPNPQGAKYPAFVVDEVMPFIARSFRVLDGPAHTGIGGSSYGGIAALTTVLKRPGRFGTLLLESTALFLFDRRLIEESRTLSPWPSAVYVGIGTRETDDAAILARGEGALEGFVALAKERGSRVQFTVVEGAAHNSAAWGARLPTALTFLFGRPSR
jgi:predicted alpha/beta superfamily hydrolase